MLFKLLGMLGFTAVTAKIKAILFGALAAFGVAALVVVYFKGRMDCAAANKLATANAIIKKLQREAKHRDEQLEQARKQALQHEQIEAENDEVGPQLDAPVLTPCGLGADWMRGLSKLR